jgi:carbon-monoxide dehydrogenase medium subunit
MKAPAFAYVRPDTLAAVLDLLARHGEDAAVLAGGQSLMPMMNLRMTQPRLLVDINRIPGLDGIEADGAGLRIGALARHAGVAASSLARTRAPLVVEALGHVAHAAIRNRGTIGGSLVLSDPAAELPACAVCLSAGVVLASAAGEREVAAAAFHQGLFTTARRADELLLRICIPAFPPGWQFSFTEVARRRGDYAIAGLAFAWRREGPGADCRVAFCGIEPAPRRLPAVEALVAGGADRAAVLGALDMLDPMGTGDAPPAYRRRLAGVLLDRALDRVEALADAA